MISGANEEELNVANDRADLLLEIEKQKGTIQYLSECINEKDGLIIAYRKEIDRLNNIINQADNKNLELIQKINKIYDVIENKNITGIEARLLIQDILDKEE